MQTIQNKINSFVFREPDEEEQEIIKKAFRRKFEDDPQALSALMDKIKDVGLNAQGTKKFRVAYARQGNFIGAFVWTEDSNSSYLNVGMTKRHPDCDPMIEKRGQKIALTRAVYQPFPIRMDGKEKPYKRVDGSTFEPISPGGTA